MPEIFNDSPASQPAPAGSDHHALARASFGQKQFTVSSAGHIFSRISMNWTSCAVEEVLEPESGTSFRVKPCCAYSFFNEKGMTVQAGGSPAIFYGRYNSDPLRIEGVPGQAFRRDELFAVSFPQGLRAGNQSVALPVILLIRMDKVENGKIQRVPFPVFISDVECIGKDNK